MINWDLRQGSGQPSPGQGGRGRGNRGRTAPNGTYLVELKVDGQRFAQTFSIEADPGRPADAVAEDELMNFWLELGEGIEMDR